MATLNAELAGSSSNSYVTLENANGIAENMTFATEWAAATEDAREFALINATRWMETLDYGGSRCKSSQRLKWPRQGASCDGVTSDCSGIPYAIQETEVALAYQWIANPGEFPDQGGGGQQGTYIKRQKLGELEQEFAEYSSADSSCDNCSDPPIISAFPWLRAMLGCWLDMTFGSSKVLYRLRS
jgi:hypothetical protein